MYSSTGVTYNVNDVWNAIDLSPSASMTLSPRSCARLYVVGLLFQTEIKKSTIDIWNPQCLWLCNKSYAPGACTSLDATRLLFD